MLPFLEIVKVQIGKPFVDRRDWIKYLVYPRWHIERSGDVFTKAPDAKFNTFVEGHVMAYLKGTMPPQGIQSSIINIADDYLCGREAMIRAGDYIALQNEYRAGKK